MSSFFIAFLLSIELKNEFLKVIYNEKTSRFLIYTVKGVPQIPTDDNKPMVFYETVDGVETSFMKFRLNGRIYTFGKDFDSVVKSPILKGNAIEAGYRYGDVEVFQKLEFVKGATTENMDALKIQYRFINKSDTEKTLDVSLILDTYLGKNDGAPFSIPGKGYITTDTEFKGSIPSYWYALDSIKNPSLSAIGVVNVKGLRAPDRVVFTNWPNLYYTKSWHPELKEGRKFRASALEALDSAFASYWDSLRLGSGPVEVGMIYGVYGVDIKAGDVLTAAISAPRKVLPDRPFTITCDVENTSNIKIENLVCELITPDGVAVTGESKNIISIDAGEIKNLSYEVKPSGSFRNLPFELKLSYEITLPNFEKLKKTHSISRTVTLIGRLDVDDINNEISAINSKIFEINKLIK